MEVTLWNLTHGRYLMEPTSSKVPRGTYSMEVTFWNVHHESYLKELTPWKLPHGKYTK